MSLHTACQSRTCQERRSSVWLDVTQGHSVHTFFWCNLVRNRETHSMKCWEKETSMLLKPRRASMMAVASPAGPPPTTPIRCNSLTPASLMVDPRTLLWSAARRRGTETCWEGRPVLLPSGEYRPATFAALFADAVRSVRGLIPPMEKPSATPHSSARGRKCPRRIMLCTEIGKVDGSPRFLTHGQTQGVERP